MWMENLIGKKIDGRYAVQEVIGVGGMAIVYKAYDEIDDRVVALKVLKEEYAANEEFKRRFRNESRAVAMLSHPNIVRVYDVSMDERMQYIVMEFVDGITLKEYIDQQHALNWKEAVHFTVQILRALQHAHEKGIIHRDIKPQNIMMLEDGTVKVTDFGIARVAGSETRTMTDHAIGSVHYISPEQASGRATDVKSDIYSLGVVLYEMLTGRLPFESENAVSVAIMQMQTQPRSPREINPDIPEGLESITLRAMQKEPERRYASAAAMLADINAFKQNPSIHFAYKYFVDDSPTRYYDAVHRSHDEKIDPKEIGPQSEEEEMKQAAPKAAAARASGGKKKKQKTYLSTLARIAIVLAIVAAGVLGVLAIMLGIFPHSTTPDVTVPNFVGMDYETDIATNTTYTGKFQFKTETQYDSAPAGQVIAQDRPAKTTVKKNAVITLTLSKGARQVEVPNVANRSESDAESALTAAGFKYTTVEQNDDSVASGSVISTDPVGGTTADEGSTVTITVSKGPTVVYKTVPDVSGKTQDQAKALIEAAGLKMNATTAASDTVTSGYVISQDPTAKTQLAQNSAVNVVISSGKAQVTVPSFSGWTLSAATTWLQQNGMTMGTPDYEYSDSAPADTIYWQSVTGATDAGSTVTVKISRGPKPTNSPSDSSSSSTNSGSSTASH